LAREQQWPMPVYTVVAEIGPAHSRMFTVEVRLGDVCWVQAEGSSKKNASQAAARAMVEQFLTTGAIGSPAKQA